MLWYILSSRWRAAEGEDSSHFILPFISEFLCCCHLSQLSVSWNSFLWLFGTTTLLFQKRTAHPSQTAANLIGTQVLINSCQVGTQSTTDWGSPLRYLLLFFPNTTGFMCWKAWASYWNMKNSGTMSNPMIIQCTVTIYTLGNSNWTQNYGCTFLEQAQITKEMAILL